MTEQEKFHKNIIRSTRFPRSAKEGLGSNYEPEKKESTGFLIVSWIVIAVLIFLFLDEITRQLAL